MTGPDIAAVVVLILLTAFLASCGGFALWEWRQDVVEARRIEAYRRAAEIRRRYGY